MGIHKELYRDEFEKMLQEAAGSFRMYPAPRVWHSIYNDLHPGKKWPSAASWLLIIFSFLLLSRPDSKSLFSASVSKQEFAVDQKTKTDYRPAETSRADHPLQLSENEKKKVNSAGNKPLKPYYSERSANVSGILSPETNTGIHERNFDSPNNSGLNLSKSYQVTTLSHSILSDAAARPRVSTPLSTNVSDSKFEYQLYATPSVGFRELKRRNEDGSLQDESSTAAGMTSFNMEAGGNIIYRYNPYMRFKAGLQLNYSSARFAEGSESESGTASFLSPDPMTMYPASMQDPGSNGIYKENYQVSVPLGADLMLAGSDNIQWFAGATVQPTLMLAGNNKMQAYGTENYMINDRSAIRNWNLNGGIETFVSFKTNSGIILNAGPQFRYQLLSTYRDPVLYNERLYTIGLKIGISSRF